MNSTKVQLATSAQKMTENDLTDSAGFDCGNGIGKLALSGSEARIPSYVPIQPDRLYDAPAPINGGLVRYLEGDRADLVGTQWLAGQPAYQRDPMELQTHLHQ